MLLFIGAGIAVVFFFAGWFGYGKFAHYVIQLKGDRFCVLSRPEWDFVLTLRHGGADVEDLAGSSYKLSKELERKQKQYDSLRSELEGATAETKEWAARAALAERALAEVEAQ